MSSSLTCRHTYTYLGGKGGNIQICFVRHSCSGLGCLISLPTHLIYLNITCSTLTHAFTGSSTILRELIFCLIRLAQPTENTSPPSSSSPTILSLTPIPPIQHVTHLVFGLLSTQHITKHITICSTHLTHIGHKKKASRSQVQTL